MFEGPCIQTPWFRMLRKTTSLASRGSSRSSSVIRCSSRWEARILSSPLTLTFAPRTGWKTIPGRDRPGLESMVCAPYLPAPTRTIVPGRATA